MTRLALPLCLLFAIAVPVHAESDATGASPPEGWEFSLAPYFWAVGLEGDLVAEKVSADIDVEFSDIWGALDVGVLSAFEARNGRFNVATNAIYLKLSADAEKPKGSVLPGAPPGSFEVRSTVEEIIFELFPRFEVLSLPLFDASGERRIALDLGPGARAFWVNAHLDVKLDPGSPLGPFSNRFDERTFWVDLVGTARVRAELTESLRFVVAGDYGGFDIGSSSHRTWSLQGYGIYRLGEHWDVAAGWRTLEIDRGAIELEMAGPLLGFVRRF